jgi:hypothetical protein
VFLPDSFLHLRPPTFLSDRRCGCISKLTKHFLAAFSTLKGQKGEKGQKDFRLLKARSLVFIRGKGPKKVEKGEHKVREKGQKTRENHE